MKHYRHGETYHRTATRLDYALLAGMIIIGGFLIGLTWGV